MADFDLQGLLGQFQPTDEDKRRAMTQALATAGFGILGARNVSGLQALGQGGLMGMQAYNGALDDVSKQHRSALQDALGAMQVKEGIQKFADQDKMRADAADIARQFQTPPAGVSPKTSAQFGPDAVNSGMDATLGTAPPLTGGRAMAAKLQQISDVWMAKGNMDMAQKYSDAARKALPKSAGISTMTTPDGKRVQVQRYEDGSYEVLHDVGPDKEKLNFQNTGGSIVGLDPFTGQPASAGIATSMTPGEQASNAVALANLALARNRDAREAANAPGNKPTWDSTSGQFVFAPTADNPTGRAVSPEGFSKQPKPLSESQAKAAAFVNQMEGANRELADLAKSGFTGAGTGQTQRVAMAGTEGIPYIPGTAMVPRMFAGKDAQRYQQAEMTWTEAALRFMTGANAPEAEVKRNAETFFPRPGDDAAKIEQKARARETMENSIRLASGNAQTSKPAGSQPAKALSQADIEAEMRRRGLLK